MSVRPTLRERVARYPARGVVTISGSVVENDPGDQDNEGARHQILIVRVDAVRSARTVAARSGPARSGPTGSGAVGLGPAGSGAVGLGPAPAPGDLLLVAIRYGDWEGLEQPIPNVTPGSPIAARGAYIPPDKARQPNPVERHGVLHFTHRPVGWVAYGGRRYD